VAANAVDGNLTMFADERTCAHTTEGTATAPAWWQVDLGDGYRITGIKIYNRQRNSMYVGFQSNW